MKNAIMKDSDFLEEFFETDERTENDTGFEENESNEIPSLTRNADLLKAIEDYDYYAYDDPIIKIQFKRSADSEKPSSNAFPKNSLTTVEEGKDMRANTFPSSPSLKRRNNMGLRKRMRMNRNLRKSIKKTRRVQSNRT